MIQVEGHAMVLNHELTKSRKFNQHYLQKTFKKTFKRHYLQKAFFIGFSAMKNPQLIETNRFSKEILQKQVGHAKCLMRPPPLVTLFTPSPFSSCPAPPYATPPLSPSLPLSILEVKITYFCGFDKNVLPTDG